MTARILHRAAVAATCHDTPGFQLNSAEWEYDTNTWHTNRDTFDKATLAPRPPGGM